MTDGITLIIRNGREEEVFVAIALRQANRADASIAAWLQEPL